MTNEERAVLNEIAKQIELGSGLEIHCDSDAHELAPHTCALIARCLHIVAGAKVQYGYVVQFKNGKYYGGTSDINKARLISDEDIDDFDTGGAPPVRRYTFTEQLTTEQP